VSEINKPKKILKDLSPILLTANTMQAVIEPRMKIKIILFGTSEELVFCNRKKITQQENIVKKNFRITLSKVSNDPCRIITKKTLNAVYIIE